ncbi:MAG: 3-methyl-2-oxobutanoate hydroxymethyltransferase [Pseudomonadales bacterium]
MSKITLSTLKRCKAEGKKFVALTSYDASFAQISDEAGIEVLLVGDSLGNVIQGHESTVPVTIDQMVYHIQAVARGNKGALIIADMPYMTYTSETAALENATHLMQAGAHIIKLEGGAWLSPIIKRLTECGIPVCGHLGLTPQSVDKLGGYRVQGTDQQSADNLKSDALALQAAGADLLVLECIPAKLAAEITPQLSIPTIGIGAGAGTDAQVMVLHDILGLNTRPTPKFVKNFLADSGSIEAAIAAYAEAVRNGAFPAPEHCYN